MPKAIRQYMQVAPYLLVGLILTMAFVLYPMVKGMYISFFRYSVVATGDSTFIGFDNYARAFRDAKMGVALRNTAFIALVTVPGQWLCGLLLALLINLRYIRAKVMWRFVYYLPVISSWIVVSYLFRYLFSDGHDGAVNYVLADMIGIAAHPIGWLQHTWTANAVIWLVSIWKGSGWVMVMYLAALQSIPVSLFEAAAIDGAKGARAFVHITLPLMRPATAYIVINLINGAIQAFIQVYAITQGGPMDSTQLLNTYMYKQAFQYFDFGYASAISVCIGVLIFAITYNRQRKLGKERIEY